MNRLFLYILLIIPMAVTGQQADSIPHSPIYTWNWNRLSHTSENTQIDTALNGFINYRFAGNPDVAFLGNYGSPAFDMNPETEYFFGNRFLKTFSPYTKHFRNNYFNTKKSYTLVTLYTNGSRSKAEQILEAVHTQNITPKLNFSLQGNTITALGTIINQENRQTNVRIASNYSGEIYRFHLSALFVRNKTSENGGITNDTLYADSLYEHQNLSVYLPDARLNIWSKDFAFDQSLRLLSLSNSDDSTYAGDRTKLAIGHSFGLQIHKRIFTASPDTNYFINIFQDSLATYDSVRWQIMNNEFYLWLANPGKLNAALKIGAFIESSLYSLDSNEIRYNDAGIMATVYSPNPGKLNFYASIRYWLQGYQASGFRFNGNLEYIPQPDKKNWIMGISTEFSSLMPDYYDLHYSSNHYWWDTTAARMSLFKISAYINSPEHHFRFLAGFTSGTDLWIPDSTGQFGSQTSSLSMPEVKIHKIFAWKFLRLANTLALRFPDNEYYGVPMYSGVHALYAEGRLFKKVLLAQVGVQVNYMTSFYAPAWNPATGSYYSQSEKQVGGYPYVEPFMAMKLKRARIFLAVEHVNYQMMKGQTFTVLHYPMPARSFRMGISWGFYD